MSHNTPVATRLSSDARRIWFAGLSAVRSERLMREAVHADQHWLVIDNERIDLRPVRRIVVVGGGKAGAGMASELEAILGPELRAEKQLSGWVNVPADCARPLANIHLHAARPPGRNEPTEAGVYGVQQMLELVESLGPQDLCLALISGGGSALMPAPVDGVSLADKLDLTRHLSAAGANIAELNVVRKQLSRLKGGGLARHCRAGTLIALIISDVPGDPLDVIASGPTVPDTSTPEGALAVLDRFGVSVAGIAPAAVDYLQAQAARKTSAREPARCDVRNIVIGNNATAVAAAGAEAERLGYAHALLSANHLEGPVEDIGRHFVDLAFSMRAGSGPNCLVSGGEGTVALAPEERRGIGGRNQQLVLAALEMLLRRPAHEPAGIALLSGGTDGEDGPTDAAGAWLDDSVIDEARRLALDAASALGRNDAYPFFERLRSLLKTGPTHTNVCDVRVLLVHR
jgi:hydroxypyruvate reductase